jgi:hypothetical protein
VTEWRIYPDADVPHVSTPEFHQHRERAPHLEQPGHQGRLAVAADLVRGAGLLYRSATGERGTFSDLGCGDGGLLSVVQDEFRDAWGYDFQPSNAAGWAERGVTAYQADLFSSSSSLFYRDEVELGEVIACTEVLEHLASPHGVLKQLREHPVPEYLVCSSPVNESDRLHDECHAWAWDYSGYEAMVHNAGWKVTQHVVTGPFQVIQAAK